MFLRQKNALAILLMLLSISCLPALAQTEQRPSRAADTPVLWREPIDIEARNLLLGAGGAELKPDLSAVTFIKAEQGGYSTKYRVRDAAGNEWVAKIGKEAQSETAANRLVWAVGYETEIVYLVPRLTIAGKGTFDNVRLEARPKDVKRAGEWSWDHNLFAGTPQFQGLKIMMVLINNWDMKDSNNVILAANDNSGPGELRYVISDLGGSLGKTGGIFSRSRNKPSDFVKTEFIDSVKNNVVDFHYNGKKKGLFEDITLADVKWLNIWLGRLSDDQIKDAFRAANYSPEEVEAFARATRDRINLLSNLSQ